MYMVATAIFCLAAMGLTKFEALVVPGFPLRGKLKTYFGFRRSPRLTRGGIECAVGDGKTLPLVPVELEITLEVLHKAWSKIQLIYRDRFRDLDYTLVHSGLVDASFKRCGVTNSAPGSFPQFHLAPFPDKLVIDHERFFGSPDLGSITEDTAKGGAAHVA